MTAQRSTLASRVLAGGIQLMLTQGITMITYFLAQRMILSTLTKEANGELFAVRRIADLIVIMLVDAGLNGIAMRRIIQDPSSTQRVLSTTVMFRLVMWVVGTMVCMLTGWLMHASLPDLVMWCVFLLISVRSGLIRFTFELPYRAHVRFGIVNVLAIVDAAMFLGLIYVYRSQLSPATIILASVLSAIPGFVLLALYDRGRTIRPQWASPALLRSMLTEAVPIIITSVLVSFHDKIDAMMLDWFSTPLEVGVFGAAYNALSPLTAAIPSTMAMAIVPAVARLAREDMDACRRYATTGLRFLIVISIGVCTVLSTITAAVIDVVSKNRYADNGIHFFTFLWMPVAIFMLVYVQELNIALGEQRKNFLIASMLAGITVVSGLVLIPMHDAYGAIVAKFLAVGCSAAVSYVVIHRVLDLSVDLWFVIRAGLAITVCCMAAAMMPGLIGQFWAAVVNTIIFLGTMIGFRIVHRGDITLIRRLLTP
jgi:O-antigen/teichoic acid export membrane protein